MQASFRPPVTRTQKGGEPGVLLSCQPGRQGPATPAASAGQPAAPRTTGPCAGQGISACRASPTAGARGGAQGPAAARRTRAMTPLPAGHAPPMGCQTRLIPAAARYRESAPRRPITAAGRLAAQSDYARPVVRRGSAGFRAQIDYLEPSAHPPSTPGPSTRTPATCARAPDQHELQDVTRPRLGWLLRARAGGGPPCELGLPDTGTVFVRTVHAQVHTHRQRQRALRCRCSQSWARLRRSPLGRGGPGAGWCA